MSDAVGELLFIVWVMLNLPFPMMMTMMMMIPAAQPFSGGCIIKCAVINRDHAGRA